MGDPAKTLQYKARADEAFKTGIKKIRKTTEQEVVNYMLTPSSGTMKGESLNAKEHLSSKEAHTELRNCKHEIKEIKKFSEFRA